MVQPTYNLSMISEKVQKEFALVRPVIEAVVRAHVTLMGSDEDLA